jgi:hypothetical protein
MYMIFLMARVLIFFASSPLFGEETLDLPVTDGYHLIGNYQNNLGINAYKKKRVDQVLKYFQVDLLVNRKKRRNIF